MKQAGPVAEDVVLRPVDPALTDDNDWPIFPLINAEVLDESNCQPASLLTAGDSRPLSLVGRLERVPRGLNSALVSKDLLPATVKIDKVQHFAYGQFDDGEVAFWAAGKAGWFEIRPSRQYRAVFRDMTDAINILYFAADFYRDKRPRELRAATLDALLAEYAGEPSFRYADETAARASILRHRRVLHSMMAEGKEGIQWRQTALFKMLEREPSAPTDRPVTPDRTSDDDIEMPHRLASKGKSSLRPKHGAQSSKAAARQAALGIQPDDENTDSSSPNLKRKIGADSDTSPRRRGRPAKRQKSVEPGADDSDDAGTDDDAGNTNDPEDDVLPLRYPPLSKSRATTQTRAEGSERAKALAGPPPPPRYEVEIVKEPLPSFAPNLPGDVWQCSFDGCSHKVYAASSEQARGLIGEHYRSHAAEYQTAIDVVQREERPYLPVSHLIKRIREIAALKKPGEDAAAAGAGMAAGGMPWKQSAPRSIKQRY